MTAMTALLESLAWLYVVVLSAVANGYRTRQAKITYAQSSARHRADRTYARPVIEIMRLGTCRLLDFNGRKVFVYASA